MHLVLLLAPLSILFYLLILRAAANLPLFDASPLLVPVPPVLQPLLRWDAFHFLNIAQHHYRYENEWAFFPGAPFIISLLLPANSLVHLAAAVLLACDTSYALYTLSLYHLRSHHLALLASLLSLIPTSPVTLRLAPYNEPFVTYLSYRGMLCCTRKQWLLASLLFTLAGAFRSNAFLLSGFILWGLLVRPFLDGTTPTIRTLFKATGLTALVIAPFVAYHIYTYTIFCSGPQSIPTWCNNVLPSLYTHVQSNYWNVGFLRYWTSDQLPNFLISAPTVSLISAFSLHHSRLGRKQNSLNQCFDNASITPHVIHAMIMMFILVFASHTQIVLRLAASMPVVHWAGAWLLYEHPKIGGLWVTWSVLWSIISTILWATFLPPA